MSRSSAKPSNDEVNQPPVIGEFKLDRKDFLNKLPNSTDNCWLTESLELER